MASKMLSNVAQISNRCLLSKLRFDKVQLELRRTFIRKNERRKAPPTPPDIKIEMHPIRVKNLWKQLLFTIMVSDVTLIGATIWEMERRRKHLVNDYFVMHSPSDLAETLESTRILRPWWSTLTQEDKMFLAISFLNVIIYSCWKVPKLRSTMYRYFCVRPTSRAICWPMLLSTFSHKSLPHLGLNIFALSICCHMAIPIMGIEQFLVVYLTSAVVGNFASQLLKTVVGSAAFSLGGAGAIFGLLGYITTQFPEARVTIEYLPSLPISMGTGLKAILLLDVVGCIMRWRYFDHAAHLGGALFGICWHNWGSANVWDNRILFKKLWSVLRKPRTSRSEK